MTESTAAKHLGQLGAIRSRAALVLEYPDELRHFDVHLEKLPAATERVLALVRRDYPNGPQEIPAHSRWRHFDVKGVKRVDAVLDKWAGAGVPLEERVRRLLDLFMVSVLLDAGAGSAYKFQMPGEEALGAVGRSEGLALASLAWFLAGGLSSDPAEPHRVDATALQGVTVAAFETAFQVRKDNPLVGVEGRVALLNRLGKVLAESSVFGPAGAPGKHRPGFVADFLQKQARGGSEVDISALWDVVLVGLAGIWPESRTQLDGVSLGDVWPCAALLAVHKRLRAAGDARMALVPSSSDGLMPFHKLSQWLTYSLMEPLELLGLRFAHAELMTGLAEYRNGGFLVDTGVITLKAAVLADPAVAKTDAGLVRVPASNGLVVEWRALTVALLDRVGDAVRHALGMSVAALPLVKILEAGTWKAGRETAAELRPSTCGPPIEVISDGTLF